MKVLMLGWEFPPFNAGGLGVACYGLCRALAQKSVEVSFVLPRRVAVTAPWCNFLFADDYISFPRNAGLYSAYARPEDAAATSKSTDNQLFDDVLRYADAASYIAADTDFDIIHAHDWLTFPAAIAVKKLTGKPLIVHVHATEYDRTGNNGINNFVYGIERAGVHFADQVFAVSEYTKRLLVERYGVDPGRITVVHNGIEASDYAVGASPAPYVEMLRDRGAHIVLFVGRITLQKGPDYFIEMARRVLSFEPNTYFIMAGSGDMEGQIIQQAAYLGISDRVIFTGFTRGEELSRLYRSADVLVMPSVSEPFGIVPLEALLHRTPVLVSKQSGVSEVLRHALHVDFWDVDEMANQLVTALRHRSLLASLEENGSRNAFSCAWSKAADTCQKAYRFLLNAARKPL